MRARAFGIQVMAAALVIWPPSAEVAGAGRLRASIAGHAVPPGLTDSVVVEQDLDQPDMAAIRLRLSPPGWGRRLAAAAPVEVTVERGEMSGSLFKGEIVGIEPDR